MGQLLKAIGRKGACGLRCRPWLEQLEDRCLPSTFSVINTSDSGLGSLRQAVLDANAHGNFLNPGGAPDLIAFNIPADDPGHVYYRNDGVAAHLTLASINTTTAAVDSAIADIDPDWPHGWFAIKLPIQRDVALLITDGVVINGYSQAGASANTNGPGLGDNAVLRIELDGTGSHYKEHRIKLTADVTYVIEMNTADGKQLDPFLRLETAAGRVVAFDDDNGGDLNARIVYTPVRTAEYRIIATVFDTQQIGPYTLIVSEAAKEAGPAKTGKK